MNDRKSSRFKGINIIKLIEFITAVGILAIAVILILQVVGRYLLKYPFIWPEEIAGFIFVWVIFIGSTVAYDRGKLLKMSFFKEKLPTLLQKVLEIAMNIIVLICLVILVIKGVESTLMVAGRKTAALRFSCSYIYMALPIGFFLLSISYIKTILKNIKEIKKLLYR